MSTPALPPDKVLLQFVEQFDKFSQQFVVAIATSATMPVEKWYTPKQMFLRILKATALASGAELQLACIAVHGAVDCLGFKGTAGLVQELWRKRNVGKKK